MKRRPLARQHARAAYEGTAVGCAGEIVSRDLGFRIWDLACASWPIRRRCRMKLFTDDGKLRPKVGLACAIATAVFSLVTGTYDLMNPSTALDRPFGVFLLVGVPIAIYAALHLSRKAQPPDAEAPDPRVASPQNQRRRLLLISVTGSLSALVFSWLSYRTGAPGWIAAISGTITIIIFISVPFLARRRGHDGQAKSQIPNPKS